MPVEDDINLDGPLSESNIRKLKKDADVAERDAERIEQAVEKARRAKTNMLGIGGMGDGEYDPKYRPDQDYYDKSTLDRNVSFVPRGGLPETTSSQMGGSLGHQGLPSKGRRSGQTKSSAPIAGISLDTIEMHLEDLRMKDKEHERKLKEADKRLKQQELQRQQMVGNVGAGFGKVQTGFAFSRSPMRFVQGTAMQLLGKATIYGAIAAMVIEQVQSIYQQVIDEVKALYEPGGVLDVRKDQLNALRQVSSISSLIDMEQGRVFYTSDSGEILRQGVPQATNTNQRLNGFKQYLQEFAK